MVMGRVLFERASIKRVATNKTVEARKGQKRADQVLPPHLISSRDVESTNRITGAKATIQSISHILIETTRSTSSVLESKESMVLGHVIYTRMALGQ